jgi:hypothetical protein
VNEWALSLEIKWGILLFGGFIVRQPLINEISVALTTTTISFFFISLYDFEKILADPRKVK